ncbi:MAG: LysM peptidoglycan-binding domain-containing protein [Spirochaetaceae bacterium]|jgi:hypothetical protein|nr:LysM peptidoglycan-binding domain-containing protein [Spirochaetaceae bacterium]
MTLKPDSGLPEMLKDKPVRMLLVLLAVCSSRAFADDDAARILSVSPRFYEKYLPFNDYIRLSMVRDAVIYTEKSDPAMSRHILVVSEKEILGLYRSGMEKLAERMSHVDRKLSELIGITGITGPAEAEIAMLDREYADYKANIGQHPEADEVMDKIEKLYAELILRKRYEQRVTGTVYTVYIVKQGDWLVKIAGLDAVYGDWRKWRLIYEANKGTMPNPNNPALIFPGMRLAIPRN